MTENGRDTQTRQCGAAEVGALAYCGEMFRSTVWRTRLGTTTNWAVVTTGIARSGTFSSVQVPSNGGRRRKRAGMYGKGARLAADFSRWLRLSMMPLLKAAEMAGNHGGQLELPGYAPRRLAYFPQ